MFHTLRRHLAHWSAALGHIADQHPGVLSVSARPAPDHRSHEWRADELSRAWTNDTGGFPTNVVDAAPLPTARLVQPVQH